MDAVNIINKDSNGSINLILTDVNTEGTDTFDMLNSIRKDRQDILAIIMTPLAHNKIFEHISEIDNKNDYISEPIDIDEFTATVKANVKKLLALKEVEKEDYLLKQYKSALNEVAQTATIDLEGKTVSVNEYFCDVFSVKETDVIGKEFSNFFSNKYSNETWQDVWTTLCSLQIWRGCFVSQRADSTLIHGRLTAMPLFNTDGEVIEYLIIRNDTSELKRETLIAKNSVKAKEEFLANMSHEIRTPLNGIIGYAHLLENLSLPEKASKYTHYISESGEFLLNTINQLLDLSKIKSGHLELYLEWFNAKEEFQTIKNMFLFSAEDKSINFLFNIDKDMPKIFFADIFRIKQVLTNFIGNAFKFTKSEVVVEIVVLTMKLDNVQISFSVKDDGIGIAEDEQKNIFKAFVQEDTSTTKNYGGTGLGLATAVELLAMMDSKIELISAKGEGSEFKFVLDLPYSYEVIDRTIEAENQSSQNKNDNLQFSSKVLIAEDNEINQSLMRDTLELYGIDIEFANNGQEAFDLYSNRSYDLIFMDLNMPVLDGLEATKKILDYENKNDITHTPIIALTANVILGDKQRCIDAGMDNYLAKPFKISELESI